MSTEQLYQVRDLRDTAKAYRLGHPSQPSSRDFCEQGNEEMIVKQTMMRLDGSFCLAHGVRGETAFHPVLLPTGKVCFNGVVRGLDCRHLKGEYREILA
jgi:hypothetical protein